MLAGVRRWMAEGNSKRGIDGGEGGALGGTGTVENELVVSSSSSGPESDR